MKIISLFLIILFSLHQFSYENVKIISLRQLQPRNPFDRYEELENEEKKLTKEYEEKMKENDILVQQISKKIKYIKILVSTGFIKLIITILLITKIYSKCQKQNRFQTSQKDVSIRNKEINIKDRNKNEISLESNQSSILSTSNSSIQMSSYNLLNSKSNMNVNINNDDIKFYQISEQSNNDYLFAANENENEKNFDAPNAPKIEEDPNVVINDDNKTLTNNHDVFIQSRMDKILYKPYSEEEIKK